MSVLSALTNSGKTQGLEDAFHTKDITSANMREAIELWFAMYYDELNSATEDNCQRLAVAIVSKLYKTVFSEYDVQISGANKDFLTPLTDKLDKVRKKAMQAALIGGECFIKPVLSDTGFDFVVIRRDGFIPFSRDSHGKITSAGTTETTIENGRYYTLAERRTVTKDGVLTIENRLYVSDSPRILGVQVSLSALEKYENIAPEIRLSGIYNLGMVRLKTPLENCVDGSDDGVAVYAPAAKLIRNINRNERELNDEFENGASRIIASADMVDMDIHGKKNVNSKLFVGIDDDADNVGITIFSPELREASYLARKQEYLRNVESLIGLKRGILSEVEASERTATEITSSAGDYNLTIIDIQNMWTEMLKELLCTCERIGANYKMCRVTFDPEADIAIDYGDGVLYNRNKTWEEYKGMVAAGLIKPELAVAWYFELPHDTEKDLEYIRKTYMPEMEQMAEDDS